MPTQNPEQKSKPMRFIVSDEKNPSVVLKAGMKFQVTAVELVDTSLKRIKKGGARLCGGTSTCVALVDISDRQINPVE